jgi:hypothetical protein
VINFFFYTRKIDYKIKSECPIVRKQTGFCSKNSRFLWHLWYPSGERHSKAVRILLVISLRPKCGPERKEIEIEISE